MTNMINAKNTTVTDGIRGYIEKRFAKFDKFIDDIQIEIGNGDESIIPQ